ncbi:NUDIX hydrolase [Actinomadura formosensis]|uniref:NUDIX hydrolase n=1 Tax=Actinomadura formosensis TaxID=60706 RepID=UPI003D9060F7
MGEALAEDDEGNALLGFPAATHTPAAPLDAPMPAALAAVWHDYHLLLVFDRHRHRHQWELPEGRIEPGETPLEAAVRELREESGLHLPGLVLAGHEQRPRTHPGHPVGS